jgi:hypothetical protein
MFIVNTLVDTTIIDRSVFFDIRAATYYAQQRAKEKVWRLSPERVYYGNVNTYLYEPKLEVTSDYQDEHILSFIGSM